MVENRMILPEAAQPVEGFLILCMEYKELKFDIGKLKSERFINKEYLRNVTFRVGETFVLKDTVVLQCIKKVAEITETDSEGYEYRRVPKTWLDQLLHEKKWLQLFRKPEFKDVKVKIIKHYHVVLPNVTELNDAIELSEKGASQVYLQYTNGLANEIP